MDRAGYLEDSQSLAFHGGASAGSPGRVFLCNGEIAQEGLTLHRETRQEAGVAQEARKGP